MGKLKKQSKISKSKTITPTPIPSDKTPEQIKQEINEYLAKQKIMKIMVYGKAPFIKDSTGILGNYLVQGFLNLGIPTLIVANYGVETGGYIRFGSATVLPVLRPDDDKKGFATTLQHFFKFKMDTILYIDKDFQDGKAIATKVPTWVIARLDSIDYPSEALEALKAYKEVIAPTQFAEKELTKHGIPCTYIPLGVNVANFNQYPKLESRKYFAVPNDHFCIGIVADNKDREPKHGWDSMFEAISIFFKMNPEAQKKTTILIHSDRRDKDGIDLEKLSKGFGIDDNCIVQDPHLMLLGIPEGALARMYSSMDVLLHLSRRCGSGMTILEAEACGVPAIVTDFGAQSERVNYGKCGWLVPVVHLVPNEDNTKSAIPEVQKAAEALTEAYKDKKKRDTYSKKAKIFARNCSWDVILEQKWLAFLDKKGEEFFAKTKDTDSKSTKE